MFLNNIKIFIIKKIPLINRFQSSALQKARAYKGSFIKKIDF